jgi:hypothetical protein
MDIPNAMAQCADRLTDTAQNLPLWTGLKVKEEH